MGESKTTRRNFLATSLTVASGIVGGASCQRHSASTTASPLSRPTPVPTQLAKMPQRQLGRTAVTVPILGLGGSASPLSRLEAEREAEAIIERSLELGIRYFDTAANYGPSEERLGKVLPSERSQLFLATKTSERSRDGAWRDLERSLQRLKTDHLDLWQFHGLAYDWDLDTILDSQQGAIKAAQEAKQQGVVRYIGITGHHNPAIMAAGLRRYPFDTVLIPINAADKHNPTSFIQTVLPVAQQKNVGVIAMKVPAYGRLFKPGLLEGMHQAMGYALSQLGVHCCIIAAENVAQLEQNVSVAQAFHPLSDEEIVAIEQRIANNWQDSSFFRAWA